MTQPYKTPDKDRRQALLIHEFKSLRALTGDPHPIRILRSIARTRTTHVIPSGWRWK